MANRKRNEVEQEQQEPLRFWGIPEFPVFLRKKIVAAAKLNDRTVADIVEEGMTEWLQKDEVKSL